MKTININGQDYTVEQLTEILEKAKQEKPFDKIFAYHGTTEEEFNKLYENIPHHIKAYEKECMLVAYYNKGWVPNFNNNDENKYYPYFDHRGVFRLCGVNCYLGNSTCSARLCWKKEEDLREAWKLYPEVFEESRKY